MRQVIANQHQVIANQHQYIANQHQIIEGLQSAETGIRDQLRDADQQIKETRKQLKEADRKAKTSNARIQQLTDELSEAQAALPAVANGTDATTQTDLATAKHVSTNTEQERQDSGTKKRNLDRWVRLVGPTMRNAHRKALSDTRDKLHMHDINCTRFERLASLALAAKRRSGKLEGQRWIRAIKIRWGRLVGPVLRNAHRKALSDTREKLRMHKINCTRFERLALLALAAKKSNGKLEGQRWIRANKIKQRWIQLIFFSHCKENYKVICSCERELDQSRINRKFIGQPDVRRAIAHKIQQLWSIFRGQYLNYKMNASKIKHFFFKLLHTVFNLCSPKHVDLPEGSDEREYKDAVEFMVQYRFLDLACARDGKLVFSVPPMHWNDAKIELVINSSTAIAKIHYTVHEEVLSLYERYFPAEVQEKKDIHDRTYGEELKSAYYYFEMICNDKFGNRISIAAEPDDKRGLQQISTHIRMVSKQMDGTPYVGVAEHTKIVCTPYEAHEKLHCGVFKEQLRTVLREEMSAQIKHDYGPLLKNWKASA